MSKLEKLLVTLLSKVDDIIINYNKSVDLLNKYEDETTNFKTTITQLQINLQELQNAKDDLINENKILQSMSQTTSSTMDCESYCNNIFIQKKVEIENEVQSYNNQVINNLQSQLENLNSEILKIKGENELLIYELQFIQNNKYDYCKNTCELYYKTEKQKLELQLDSNYKIIINNLETENVTLKTKLQQIENLNKNYSLQISELQKTVQNFTQNKQLLCEQYCDSLFQNKSLELKRKITSELQSKYNDQVLVLENDIKEEVERNKELYSELSKLQKQFDIIISNLKNTYEEQISELSFDLQYAKEQNVYYQKLSNTYKSQLLDSVNREEKLRKDYQLLQDETDEYCVSKVKEFYDQLKQFEIYNEETY